MKILTDILLCFIMCFSSVAIGTTGSDINVPYIFEESNSLVFAEKIVNLFEIVIFFTVLFLIILKYVLNNKKLVEDNDRIKRKNLKKYLILNILVFGILFLLFYAFLNEVLRFQSVRFIDSDIFINKEREFIACFGFFTLGILLIIPLMLYKKSLKKLELLDLNDEEYTIENKKCFKKFIIKFLILGIIGFIIYTFTSWITNFADKPIIYLYPEEEMQIQVKLGNEEKLTCTYPKYEDSWEVIAKPNGDLTDIKTGRNLYALYWEGINSNKAQFKEGFCIKGEDAASFLEEKLEILGLNEKEAEEFIVYWLPKLEKNKYNLIRFETAEEIEKNMPLEITPKPETIIRIMMEFKGVNKYVEIPTQHLEKVTRKGYTAVEWGGTEVR